MGQIFCRYLTTEQAAQYCGHSKRTFEDWRLRGYGPAYIKLSDNGKGVRYDIQDLDAFMLAHKVKTLESDQIGYR